jgi:hypothetical protein
MNLGNVNYYLFFSSLSLKFSNLETGIAPGSKALKKQAHE